VVLTAACADAGVETRSAQRAASAEPGGPAPPATNAPAADDSPSTTDDSPSTTDDSPSTPGHAPDEPAPTSAPIPTSAPATGTEPPDAAGPPGPNDDLASAGDSLFPELGSSTIDVQSYDVRIAYDPSTQEIDGQVVIDLSGQPSEQVVLDAGDLRVDAVLVDGLDAQFEQRGEELVIWPVTPGRQLSVDVRYQDQADDGASAAGLNVGWFATATGSYVLNEPDGAHSWLPSNDHPSDKALWRFEITVPAGLTAVANGALVEERPGDGTTTWVWEESDPMATYLVQLLTGEYTVIDGGNYGVVPLVHVALTDDAALMQPYFDVTDDQLAFFEPLFGPYPLERYGLAITDSFGGLAMETQGRSLFSRDDLPGGEPGVIEHNLLSHELAHQWFGNAVTPADWSDLWLNESFASYAAWLWLDHIGIFPLEQTAEGTLAARQFGSESTGEPTLGNLFGFERYDGGAVVLHALRRELGDEAFFAVLQTWVADNDGTSRTTDDFVGTAEQVADRSLTEFFDTWLYATDLPDGYP